ncbi:MAG TPA: MerR family transcriptional regulator [Elusimicrobiales bacterium]|nr:MerR family transcriptional regulator [Elusimicrobiales bacterium]
MKKKNPNAEALYNISVAARLCGLPAYTIRWVEKNHLVEPSRTEGNQRLFSDPEIELLREIAALLRQNVNVQGIRVVLRMRGYRIIG